MKRSGIADLPLHGGRVPPWLAERMTTLGTAIVESVLYHYGTGELLSRLSDPFWFQALGCVMGMDWHSSGITTSVLGALKRGVNPRSQELGIYICGGRGKHSRKTPDELRAIADKTGLDGIGLVRASRLTARVDNNAIADGFQLYLHAFILGSGGEWSVVQQGMNDRTGMARRYHWHSPSVQDFAAVLLLGKLGPRTLQSLALVGEVVHGAPSRFSDPARFSFAHGGKDGHPFPVPLKTYDQSIAVLRRGLQAAKLGDPDKMDGFKRLDNFVRRIESQLQPEADLPGVIAHEKKISNSIGGRTVFDDHPSRTGDKQMSLFRK